MKHAASLRSEVEYTPLGTAGQRELRGVVERRELRLGPLVFGRMRPRAVEVHEPGTARVRVPIDPPAEPYLRAVRWVLMLLALAWVAGAFVRRRRSRK